MTSFYITLYYTLGRNGAVRIRNGRKK